LMIVDVSCVAVIRSCMTFETKSVAICVLTIGIR
jgi:hypothetical protein